MNCSTPPLAEKQNLPALEFGRCLEEAMFSGSFNWFKSAGRLEKSYLESVVDAVKKNNPMPTPYGLLDAEKRPPPILMAIDFDVEAGMLCS